MWRRAWLLLFSLVVMGAAAVDGRTDFTATVNADRVNTRGGPSLSSEVVTQLQAGESVVVVESVKVARPGSTEPNTWFKIRLPTNTPVWVHAGFVDPTNRVVTARRLNVRSGPGENYSVLGRLARGEAVREIRVVDDWMEIEAPPGTVAYMASSFLTLPPSPSAQLTTAAAASPPAAPLGPSPAQTDPPGPAGAAATPPAGTPVIPASPAGSPPVASPSKPHPAPQPEQPALPVVEDRLPLAGLMIPAARPKASSSAAAP